MTTFRPIAGIVGVTAILVAACGGGGGAATTKPSTAAASAATTAAASAATASQKATAAPASQAASQAASAATGSQPAQGSSAPASVKLQLQWAPQAQFAGYFAADREGYYAAEGLTVEMLPGGPDVVPQLVGSDPAGPEFTISWVPKVLEVRGKGQSDLVDIAQMFQRSGTRSVSWAAGKGPNPTGTENITSPEQFKGKNIGAWGFGN